jgi:hypothetical protein
MERMSAKKGQSAAVGLKIDISPREVAVLFSTIFLGSLGILGIVRLLNILDSRGLSFIADLVHLLGVVKLGFNLGEEKTRAGKRQEHTHEPLIVTHKSFSGLKFFVNFHYEDNESVGGSTCLLSFSIDNLLWMNIFVCG